MKFILTAVIIYFVVRSIAKKPWIQASQNTNQTTVSKEEKTTPFDDGDFIEYEEVE